MERRVLQTRLWWFTLRTARPTKTWGGPRLKMEVAEGDDWTLRHPVGPDAAPFLEWRSGMTDEQWVEWGALSDDEWYARSRRLWSRCSIRVIRARLRVRSMSRWPNDLATGGEPGNEKGLIPDSLG